MAERTSLRGDKKIELQLSSHQPLFADQLRLLDERLSIVFGEPPSSRHAPHETKQTQEQIRQRHIHRQAHRTYNRILETIPHYFLVFILAKSPAGCARFNDSRFISDYKQKQPYPTQLNYTFKDQLIASAGQGVADCAKFREWLSLIFDAGPKFSPASATTAFKGTNVGRLNSILGDYVFNLFDKSPARAEERRLGQIDTSDCLVTYMSSAAGAFGDMVVLLDIAPDEKACEDIPPVFSKEDLKWKETAETTIYPTSVPVVSRLFHGSPINKYIEESALRTWEVGSQLGDMTSCVEGILANQQCYKLQITVASTWPVQDLHPVDK